MGNIIPKKATIDTTSYENFSDFALIKYEKNSFGNLKVVQNKKTLKIYKEKSINFDSTEKFENLKKSLSEIKKDENNFYLKIHSLKINDNRLYCSSSNFNIIFDFFEKTLQDSILENFSDFSQEYKIWRFIFDMTKILKFNKDNKIENNFIHPEAIFFSGQHQKWNLIHSQFFNCDNFTKAICQKTHFSSPELFCQIKSKSKTFKIQKKDKSNIFSLGLIILKSIFLEDLKIEKIFLKKNLNLDINEIQKNVNSLENKGYSLLLISVLKDFLNELENLRISPDLFLKSLGFFEKKLISKNFQESEKIFENYQNFKSKKDNLSFEEGVNEGFERDLSIDEKFLLEESGEFLDGFGNRDLGKDEFFDEKFMEEDSFHENFN